MRRRAFLAKSSLVSLGFLGLRSYATAAGNLIPDTGSFDKWMTPGYGPLQDDPFGILNLPSGFSYKIISSRGDMMSDGFYVPGLADGMGTFQGPGGRTIIIRNHEIAPTDINNSPFGREQELLNRLTSDDFYDYGNGEKPCLGGTTTLVYNHKTQEVERQFLSLTGTVRNCAGGTTPWGSWITCEESVVKKGNFLEKDHGYNFEVPASSDIHLYQPIPLTDMGRFNHEAVCVDPRTGIVYQTEDRPDSLIYRFIPKVPGKLHEGGRLQILALKGRKGFDTRNWINTGSPEMKPGKKYEARWSDIHEVDSPDDDLRYRGREKGAAVFARGEGMWFGQEDVYFACTNGGKKCQGQIFRYTPSPYEGQKGERKDPGTLELFIEPNNSEIVESCDNLTIGTNGDLIVCEDKKHPRIIGVTPEGKVFHLAENVGYPSEFAGAVFSPDGQTLFVNIQGPGITFAINGPFGQRLKA